MKIYEQIGLDFIFDNLKLMTSLARKKINSLQLCTDTQKIEQEFSNLERGEKYFMEKGRMVEIIRRKLKEIQDITSVIRRAKEGYILDDVDLFQIKIFSLISQEIYEIVKEELPFISPGNLEKVIDLLDPDRLRIASFHIYSSYSPELISVREEIKITRDEALYDRELAIEERIRRELSGKISALGDRLLHAVEQLIYTDLVFAKVIQNRELDLKRPLLGEKNQYRGLFHPKVLKNLEARGRKYQKIDVEIGDGVTVVTGANMSGKTLTLKTLALCQYLTQFGFFIPADQGIIKPAEGIYFSMGDSQSLESGLSSYAAEMIQIDEMIKAVKRGEKPLILIDELARTTNPQEGRAILRGVVDILNEERITSVITTHYDGVGDHIRKVRVKGLRYSEIRDVVSHKNIEEYMDYSLVEESGDKVPEEALSIAKLLKIDDEIIKRAQKYLGGN